MSDVELGPIVRVEGRWEYGILHGYETNNDLEQFNRLHRGERNKPSNGLCWRHYRPPGGERHGLEAEVRRCNLITDIGRQVPPSLDLVWIVEAGELGIVVGHLAKSRIDPSTVRKGQTIPDQLID
jgi:hypothetical protein